MHKVIVAGVAGVAGFCVALLSLPMSGVMASSARSMCAPFPTRS